MNTSIHFWSYLAHFFLEWKMFQTKVVEKIKITFLIQFFFRKSCRLLWDRVEKILTAGQVADDNMDHEYCMIIPKATNTHSEYVILIAFPPQEWLQERALLLPYTYIHCPSCFRASFNPLNAELNPISCLLALLGAHHFLHVNRIRVKLLTLRLLMSYICMYIYIYIYIYIYMTLVA